MESIIIMDMEGTLSDSYHRNGGMFDYEDPHNWHIGFSKDTVQEPMRKLLELSPFEYVILSTKPEQYRNIVEEWLYKNIQKQPKGIYLRPDNSFEKSPMLKKKILEEEILPIFNVVLAIDDRADVCREYAKMGIYSLHFRGGKVWSLTRY